MRVSSSQGLASYMAHENVTIDSFSDLLANGVVVDFVKRFELRNYRSCTLEQRQEIATIYDRAFELLSTCGSDRATWEPTINTIVYDLFRKHDPDSWFRQFYDSYSATMKGDLEFAQIKPYIKGNTILDFGCGRGHLALKCRQEGYDVLTTDVVDYRAEEARVLPFGLMGDRITIPYPDNAASTTLVFAVLHHLSGSDQEKVLNEMKRVSVRVVIKEDVYGIPVDGQFVEVIHNDEFLQEFALLQEEDQLKVLMLHDYVDNAFAQGAIDMDFPFQFRTISEWNKVLGENGLHVLKTILIGFKRTGDWTGTCHALFIADCDSG